MDGTIILNNIPPTTILDGHSMNITGTFLIIFTGTIKINQTTYDNLNNTAHAEPHPPKTMDLKHLEHEIKLSLPYLHKIHLDNTNHIASINDQIETQKICWWTITSGVSLITVTVAIVLLCKRKQQPNISPKDIEDMVKEIASRNRDASV